MNPGLLPLSLLLLLYIPSQLDAASPRNQFQYKVNHFDPQPLSISGEIEDKNEAFIPIPSTSEVNHDINNHLKQSPRLSNNASVNTTTPAPSRDPVPLVYWHGMGDCGWNVKRALSFIEDELPGVYVKSIQIGATIPEDIENSYFLNVNTQVELVCAMISNDSRLAGGYNAIGLSQGGQFLRAVAQRCPEPRMINLISLGGQHQGVFGLPKCSAPKKEWCEIIDKLVTHVAYAGWVQKFLVQAEYWHDPFKNEEYVAKSVFLADINNEREINESYRTNLQKLENLVLVQFEDETIVQPKESEWFGYFRTGSDKEMVAMENTTLFTEDRLGLKAMQQRGQLHLLSSPGDHLQFTREWFDTNILKPFLSN